MPSLSNHVNSNQQGHDMLDDKNDYWLHCWINDLDYGVIDLNIERLTLWFSKGQV